MSKSPMNNHPNSRGFYPTPLTISLERRDYAEQSLKETATTVLKRYPAISLVYLLDVLAAVFQPDSKVELQNQLPKDLQSHPDLQAALDYAYPPITSFDPLEPPKLTKNSCPYVENHKVHTVSGKKPALLIRDRLPSVGGVIYHSPDIIASKTPVNNYKEHFISHWDEDFSQGTQIEFGQPGYVYVRLENTGNVPIVPYVSIWYILYGTLIHFNEIQPVGHYFADRPLQPGEKDVIEIVWEGPENTNNYCFIGVLESPRQPVCMPYHLESHDLYQFVPQHDNVAWHNFTVVNLEPDQTHVDLPVFQASSVGTDNQLVLSVMSDSPLQKLPPHTAIQVSINKELLNEVVVDDDVPTDSQNRLIIASHVQLTEASNIDVMMHFSEPLTQPLKIAITQVAQGNDVGGVHFKIDTQNTVSQLP